MKKTINKLREGLIRGLRMKLTKKDSGREAPLLPELEYGPEKTASVSGAVFNLSTSIIGAGMMSIPATLRVLGVLPSLVLIVAIALLVDISVEFMLRFTGNSGDCTTYAGLMKQSYGRLGSAAVQICVVITNLGCLIIYLIIIGDVVSGDEAHLGILQEWFGTQWWNCRAVSLLFIVLLLILPLLLFRRVESLSLSSAVSVLLAVVFVGMCCVMAIVAVVKGETKSPRMLPQLDNQASFFNLFTAVPVIVTAFTCHSNVHPIGEELGKLSDMKTAARISLALCVALYFSIGFFGYLLFGDAIMSDILVNFNQNSGLKFNSLVIDTVRISYALHLMLVFPVINFSLRTNIDELLFPGKPLLAADTRRFLSLTFILLVLSYLAAIAIPDIWYFFQLVGSTSALCLAFVFPGSIALRDVRGMSRARDRIIAAAMVTLAVVTSSIALSTNIYGLIGKKK